MERPRVALRDRLAIAMEQMRGAIMARSSEDWSELELSFPQLRTLLLLSQGPSRMSDIAAHFGKGLSSATSLVDRLVDKGLVERTATMEDRRVVLCCLTARGQQEIDRFNRMGQRRLEKVVCALSQGELEEMINAMELLLKAMHKVDVEAAKAAVQ